MDPDVAASVAALIAQTAEGANGTGCNASRPAPAGRTTRRVTSLEAATRGSARSRLPRGAGRAPSWFGWLTTDGTPSAWAARPGHTPARPRSGGTSRVGRAHAAIPRGGPAWTGPCPCGTGHTPGGREPPFRDGTPPAWGGHLLVSAAADRASPAVTVPVVVVVAGADRAPGRRHLVHAQSVAVGAGPDPSAWPAWPGPGRGPRRRPAGPDRPPCRRGYASPHGPLRVPVPRVRRDVRGAAPDGRLRGPRHLPDRSHRHGAAALDGRGDRPRRPRRTATPSAAGRVLRWRLLPLTGVRTREARAPGRAPKLYQARRLGTARRRDGEDLRVWGER